MNDNLDRINQEIQLCIRCPLYRVRIQPVFGHIPDTAEPIIFVNDAPSSADDITGLPMTGKTGTDFSNLVYDNLGMTRDQYNILQCIKCIPMYTKDSKKIKKNSIFWCAEYLYRQIEIIRPLLIVSMGYIPFFVFVKRQNDRFVMIKTEPMYEYTGKLYKSTSIFSDFSFYVYQTFDPQAILVSRKVRHKVQQDFLALKDIWNDIRKGKNMDHLLRNGDLI